MRDGVSDKPVVKSVETPFALLFNSEFFLFRGPLDVVAQEWNEHHGNNERAQQRRGDHNRKTSKELRRAAALSEFAMPPFVLWERVHSPIVWLAA